MSFFKKVLASVGIGAAKVDTKLHEKSFVVGDKVEGVVEITGGEIEQPIDAIYLSLLTTYIRESNDKKNTETGIIATHKLMEQFTVLPNQTKEIPFSFAFPLEAPISIGKTKVWLQTGLDIKNALDPSDKDFIQVRPLPLVEKILQSVQELGFRLREVECQQAPRSFKSKLPFVQEFEFIPVSGAFRGKLDELEITFLPVTTSQVEIIMQVDRKARGLGSLIAEAFEMDETNLRLLVTENDVPHLTSKLSQIINQYS